MPASQIYSRNSSSSASSTMSNLTLDSIANMKATQQRPSTTRRAWEAIKKHAREHHASVNGAYEVYYGQGTSTRRY